MCAREKAKRCREREKERDKQADRVRKLDDPKMGEREGEMTETSNLESAKAMPKRNENTVRDKQGRLHIVEEQYLKGESERER